MTKRLLLIAVTAMGIAILAGAQSVKDPQLETELAQWRGEISTVDREIVALLNRRAQYVRKLAPLKEKLGRDVRDPGREAVVLENLKQANAGPLPDESLVNIYQAIMSAMRDLQSRK